MADDDDGDGGGYSRQQDSSFLLEMNLLTVLLSLISVSGEDRLDFDGEERRVAKDGNLKACCISRIQNRGKETNEVKLKLGRRPSQRFQPIKDFRHCRRM